MSVYLGTHGEVELQRQFDGGDLRSTITPSDVNSGEKRFSFDFEHGQLLSGDQVEITSTDDSALDFITSYTDSSVKKFIHVDELDGIRLYDSFADAVNGGSANATALSTPGDNIPIRVTVANNSFRMLAQCNGFELNTERETVDTTTLSDEFRSRVSTLMSGSGRMSCFGNTPATPQTSFRIIWLSCSCALRWAVSSEAGFTLKQQAITLAGLLLTIMMKFGMNLLAY